MRLRFALLALLGLSSCVADTDPGARGIALRDPLGLIDDVYDSGNSLRLYVLPADAYACTESTGEVLPAPPDTPEMFADAVVDITLTRDESGRREVMVAPGAYTVLVRGKGTDMVSGEMNTIIARGCGTAEVTEGVTIEVSIVLAPVVSMGMCGNTVLSPDEQCETTLPECGADCRTTQEAVNTTTAAPQTRVRVATRSGRRVLTVWDSDATSVGVRLFDESARALTGLGPLATDRPLDDLGSALPDPQSTAAVAVAADGRNAIALVDFAGGEIDVRVGFYSDTLVQMGTFAAARADRTGTQTNPALAFHSGGALMVVFQDASSGTGLSGRLFDAGATTPSGAEAFEVGTGATGGTLPAITAVPDGFVVAFAAGGDVFYQRFSATGTPTDATAQAVAPPSGARDQPTVAAMADGSFLVAFAEANAPGDGMGQGVRARVFGADGAPVGDAFLVNDTVAGDQSRPSATAAGSRFLVAFQSGTSVRARVLSAAGDPSLNRERPPTLGDFEIAPAGIDPAAGVVGTGAEQAWWIAFESAGDIFARRFIL